MKCFALALPAAALAGLLVSAGTVAQADSTMYLVPMSDMNAIYKPGDKVTVKAMLNLGSGDFGSLSVPTAFAFSTAQFAAKPDAVFGGSPWGSFALMSYAATATGPNGLALSAATASLSHAKSTAAIPAGNYTLATLTFSILPTFAGSSVSVYLPTAFNYGGGASATDGSYGASGPEFLLRGKTMANLALADALTFPNSSLAPASLTFRVAPSAVPEPGSLALCVGMASVGVRILRKRRNRSQAS